jgi:hypothetical protein
MAIINNSEKEIPVEHVIDNKVPEGMKLAAIKATCPKHGDVTAATLFTTYTTIDLEGKAVQHQNMFCIQCISEYLQKLQKAGEIQTLELKRIYAKEDEISEEKTPKPQPAPS